MRTIGSCLIYLGVGLALLSLVTTILSGMGLASTDAHPATSLAFLGIALLGWVIQVIAKWSRSLDRQGV